MKLTIDSLQKINYKEYINYNYIEKLNEYGYLVGKLYPNLNTNSENFSVIYKVRYGIIDNNGNAIIPPIYNKICGFKNGISVAEYNSEIYYFDTKGQQLKKEDIPLETRGHLRMKLNLTNNSKNISYDKVYIIKEKLVSYDKKVELEDKIKDIPKENIISNEKIGYFITLEINERNKKYYVSPKDPTQYSSKGDIFINLNCNLQEVTKDNEDNIIVKQKVIK